MKLLKLALDWTPNVNHIGFYVAQYLGIYDKNKVSVQIISPEEDNYKRTPAKKVELGQVDFALCPTESLISYQTKTKPFPLVGIANIFEKDLSAISVLNSSGIKTPKELDGKTYASYKARYEDGILKQMIMNDGGEGDLKISYPNKLGIWNRLVTGNADATWIFLNWEALQAEAEGIELTNFKLSDYDIPYSYSPVIAAGRNKVNNNRDAVEAFLEATKKGFFYAKENPQDSAEILRQQIPAEDKNIDLIKAIKISSECLGNEASWGQMKIENINSFLSWLRTKNLEHSNLNPKDLIFNF